MSYRLAKVNKNIQRILGQILQTQVDLPADVLVTVSAVEASQDLRSAKIWLSVWPSDKAEMILDLLHKQIYDLQGQLNRQLTINPLPRIKLNIDHGFQHADNIARTLADLNEK